MATTEKKRNLVKKYQKHEKDNGSANVQIALLTERINGLSEHMTSHVKDHHSRHGMLKLVGQRRRLLNYLKDSDTKGYQQLIEELGIRK